jgi:hypothetical protein
MKNAQQLATKVFIAASVLFGLTGVVMIQSAQGDEEPAIWLTKLLATFGFIVLSSFGVSVGLKYLSK